MAILIKRYANRKLYNTDTSRYITLRGIGQLLERGEDVRVVDNETGEDITQIALSQILVDNKRAREDPSEPLLTQILSRGGDAVYTAIRKSVDEASDGIGEFQERFRQLVARGEDLAHRSRPFAWDRRGRETGDADDDEIGLRNGEPTGDRTRTPGSDPGPRPPRSAREPAWPAPAEIERLNRNLERVAVALERLEATLAASRPRG